VAPVRQDLHTARLHRVRSLEVHPHKDAPHPGVRRRCGRGARPGRPYPVGVSPGQIDHPDEQAVAGESQLESPRRDVEADFFVRHLSGVLGEEPGGNGGLRFMSESAVRTGGPAIGRRGQRQQRDDGKQDQTGRTSLPEYHGILLLTLRRRWPEAPRAGSPLLVFPLGRSGPPGSRQLGGSGVQDPNPGLPGDCGPGVSLLSTSSYSGILHL